MKAVYDAVLPPSHPWYFYRMDESSLWVFTSTPPIILLMAFVSAVGPTFADKQYVNFWTICTICKFLHNLHNMSISAHVKTFIHFLCFGINMVSNECSSCGIYDDDNNYEVVDSSAMRLDPWCWWLFLLITFITEY